MALPRGFKSRANRIAIGLRAQMGLSDSAPIDIRALAEQLGISIWPLTAFAKWCPEQVSHLVGYGAGGFSALLLSLGDDNRMVIVNDMHSEVRQNNSLAHEVSHALLAHPLEILSGKVDCRDFDSDLEESASYLAGCILIPNEAARSIVWSEANLEIAKRAYGVSGQLLEYRLNMSGARIQYQRRRHGESLLSS